MYTYIGNVYDWEKTSEIEVTDSFGVDRLVKLGESVDLDPVTYSALALRHRFAPGEGAEVVGSLITHPLIGPIGPVGPQGPGFRWRGAWTPDTFYAMYDVVQIAGSSYIAPADIVASPIFDPLVWDLMAAGGEVELAHAEITANFVTTSRSIVDVPGLTIVVDVTDRPIAIEYSATIATMSTAGAQCQAHLCEIFEDFTFTDFNSVSVITPGAPHYMYTRLTPTPGQHTYRIKARAHIADGIATIWAGPEFPASIRAFKL